MPWVKLDDQFPDHPKVEQISDGAFRLHVSAMCHAQRYLTDGRIERRRPSRLMDGYRPKYLAELLDTGLWEENGAGYLIHDFTDWNKDRQWWQDRRAKEAERVKNWRAKQRGKRDE